VAGGEEEAAVGEQFIGVDRVGAHEQPRQRRFASAVDHPVKIRAGLDHIAAGFQVQPSGRFGLVIGSFDRTFGFDLQGQAHKKGVTAAMRVEFLKGTEVVARGRAWDSTDGRSRGLGGLEFVVEMDPGTERDALGAFVPGTPWTVMAPWSVRITADPILALRDFERTRYWRGTVVLPAAK